MKDVFCLYCTNFVALGVIAAIYVIEETRKADGTIQSYYEIIYFELNGKNYRFQFLCSSETAYNANKNFDFLDYANKNFIAK